MSVFWFWDLFYVDSGLMLATTEVKTNMKTQTGTERAKKRERMVGKLFSPVLPRIIKFDSV